MFLHTVRHRWRCGCGSAVGGSKCLLNQGRTESEYTRREIGLWNWRLGRARVSLLALSCTVSSISGILRQQDLTAAVDILEETFEAPRPLSGPRPRKPKVVP